MASTSQTSIPVINQSREGTPVVSPQHSGEQSPDYDESANAAPFNYLPQACEDPDVEFFRTRVSIYLAAKEINRGTFDKEEAEKRQRELAMMEQKNKEMELARQSISIQPFPHGPGFSTGPSMGLVGSPHGDEILLGKGFTPFNNEFLPTCVVHMAQEFSLTFNHTMAWPTLPRAGTARTGSSARITVSQATSRMTAIENDIRSKLNGFGSEGISKTHDMHWKTATNGRNFGRLNKYEVVEVFKMQYFYALADLNRLKYEELLKAGVIDPVTEQAVPVNQRFPGLPYEGDVPNFYRFLPQGLHLSPMYVSADMFTKTYTPSSGIPFGSHHNTFAGQPLMAGPVMPGFGSRNSLIQPHRRGLAGPAPGGRSGFGASANFWDENTVRTGGCTTTTTTSSHFHASGSGSGALGKVALKGAAALLKNSDLLDGDHAGKLFGSNEGGHGFVQEVDSDASSSSDDEDEAGSANN